MKLFGRVIALLTMACAIAILVAACGGGGFSSGGTGSTGMFTAPASPILVAPQTDTTRAASAVIPASGGALTATGADGSVFTLTVPADALQFDTAITMTPVSGIPNLPLSGGLGAAVKLEPEGLHFYNYATLTIAPANPASLAAQTFFSYQKDGEDFHLVPPVLDNTQMQVKLLHFTGVGVGGGTDADRTAILLTNAADAENRLNQGMAEVFRQAREQGGTVDTAQFNALWKAYWDQVVTPRVQAASSSCKAGRLAISTLLGVERRKALLGVASDPAAADLFLNLVPQVANTCLNEAYDACVTNHDLNAITLAVLGYEREAQLLGIKDSSMPWDANGQRLFKQCMQFELTFASTNSKGTFSGTVVLTPDMSAFPAIRLKSLGPTALETVNLLGLIDCPVRGFDNTNNLDFTVSDLRFVYGGTMSQEITNLAMDYAPLNPLSGTAATTCGSYFIPLQYALDWNSDYTANHQSEYDALRGTLVAGGWDFLGGDPFAQKSYSLNGEQTSMILRHVPNAIDVADVTAPSAPAVLLATAVSASQITLNWSASTDANGVKGYKIYRSGSYIKPLPFFWANSFADGALTDGTQYCYSVSAYDAAGNESALSAQACATTDALCGSAGNPVIANLTSTDIPDPNLLACIKVGAANRLSTCVLDFQDAGTSECFGKNITSLSGMEKFTNLKYAGFTSNRIADVTPLTNLKKLIQLHLNSNGTIVDVTPLAGLTALTSLNLSDNRITDASPLAGLTNLSYLNLNNCCGGYNRVQNLAPLSGLTKLTYLGLGNNLVSDLTPLYGLTNLTALVLYGNITMSCAGLNTLVNTLGTGVVKVTPGTNCTLP